MTDFLIKNSIFKGFEHSTNQRSNTMIKRRMQLLTHAICVSLWSLTLVSSGRRSTALMFSSFSQKSVKYYEMLDKHAALQTGPLAYS